MERGKRKYAVNTSRRKAKLIYCLEVLAMLKSLPMLGSVYSCVKEPLRNTPSKYKTINKKKERRHRGHRHRGGERGKHKRGTYLRKTPRL